MGKLRLCELTEGQIEITKLALERAATVSQSEEFADAIHDIVYALDNPVEDDSARRFFDEVYKNGYAHGITYAIDYGVFRAFQSASIDWNFMEPTGEY